jgi:hypothetical protein
VGIHPCFEMSAHDISSGQSISWSVSYIETTVFFIPSKFMIKTTSQLLNRIAPADHAAHAFLLLGIDLNIVSSEFIEQVIYGRHFLYFQ